MKVVNCFWKGDDTTSADDIVNGIGRGRRERVQCGRKQGATDSRTAEMMSEIEMARAIDRIYVQFIATEPLRFPLIIQPFMMSVNIPFTQILMGTSLWGIVEGKCSMEILIRDSRCAQILSYLDVHEKEQ